MIVDKWEEEADVSVRMSESGSVPDIHSPEMIKKDIEDDRREKVVKDIFIHPRRTRIQIYRYLFPLFWSKNILAAPFGFSDH